MLLRNNKSKVSNLQTELVTISKRVAVFPLPVHQLDYLGSDQLDYPGSDQLDYPGSDQLDCPGSDQLD